jgi:MFS family permease
MKTRILVAASFFHFLTDAAAVIIPMIFPILYSEKFLITRYSQIGLLSNVGLFTTLFVQFLVVRLSYRHEYRMMMLASGLGICGAMALIPAARTFGMLILLFMGLRIFTSFYHPVVIAWISKSRAGSGRELDDAMGIQSGSGNFGVVLGYLTVGYLAQARGWRFPLFVWAAAGLALVAAGIVILRGVSSRGEARPSLNAASWLRSLAGIKRFIPGLIYGGVGWAVVIYYAPSLLNHRFEIPMGRTGLVLALWIGLGTLTGYGYGIWSRRFGRKRVYLTSMGGGMVTLFLIGFAPAKGLAVAALIAYGGFLLMTFPSMHTFVGSTVPEAGQTQAFSWVSNIQLAAGAIVTLVSGFLSDALGIQFPFILTGILTIAVFLYYLPRGPEFFGGQNEVRQPSAIDEPIP